MKEYIQFKFKVLQKKLKCQNFIANEQIILTSKTNAYDLHRKKTPTILNAKKYKDFFKFKKICRFYVKHQKLLTKFNLI